MNEFTYDISMYDEKNGWAYGQTDSNFRLLETSDGGMHWKQATPEADLFFNETRISILNASTLWIIREEEQEKLFYFTKDKGRSWNKSLPLTTVGHGTSTSFLNPTNGWMIVNIRRVRILR